ncbi:MAG TPA: electron transfer flavoprotein subunit beta/FixA family protein [Candidatus Thermoplasmatota archaeon]
MVKIMVLVKQVPDVSQVRFEGGKAPNLASIQAKMSDADKNALEAAVQLKAAHAGSEVSVVTVGGPKVGETVNEALAIGGDKAFIVQQPHDKLDARATSELLAAAIRKAGAHDLVLCGEASTDAYQAQIGPRVAELLKLPQITFAKTVAIDGSAVVATRELGDKEQKVRADFPALVALVKDANQPRLPNLMAIMGAKKKPQTTWKPSDLGINDADMAVEKLAVQAVEMRPQKMDRKMEVLKDKPVEEAAARVVEELQKRAVLVGGN